CLRAYVRTRLGAGGRWPVRLPDPALTSGDALDRAAAHHRVGRVLEDVRIARAAGRFVSRLDEQPVLAFFTGPPAHAHGMPGAVQLLALQAALQPPLAQPLPPI